MKTLDHSTSLAPSVDPSLLALIKRLMAKHPGARFQTGHELVAAAKKLVEERTSRRVVPSQNSQPAVNATLQNGVLLTLAFTCIGILAIVLSIAWPYLKPSGESNANTVSASVPRPGDDPTPATSVESTPTRPSKAQDPDAELAEQLEYRAKAFSEAILSGDEDEAILFVEPSSRDNAGLQMSVGYLVDKVKALGNRARVQHRTRLQGEKARVIFSFSRDPRTKPIMLPLQWVVMDGGWYIEPETRDSDTSADPHSGALGDDDRGF